MALTGKKMNGLTMQLRTRTRPPTAMVPTAMVMLIQKQAATTVPKQAAKQEQAGHRAMLSLRALAWMFASGNWLTLLQRTAPSSLPT